MKAKADPTFTMAPSSRGRIRASAAIVPHTCPRNVTCTARSKSSGWRSDTGANTVVTNSDGKVRYTKATGKLEPSYAVFLFDRMPMTEKYIMIAELTARNR